MSKYTATIGIEIHVELKTNSKVFSPSKNDYNSTANTNINDFGVADDRCNFCKWMDRCT